MYERNDYADLWNEMDELLIRYPELSELWLDRDKLAGLRLKYPRDEELRGYFRKRAFTSLVMEKVFRVYESPEEEDGEEEGEGSEGLTIDNPELWRIWNEDVRDEYSDYAEFIEYVEKNVFTSAIT